MNSLLLLPLLFLVGAPSRTVRAHELPVGFNYATDKVCENDRVIEGYGCVTGELRDYGIDAGLYYQNAFDSKVLLTADSAKKVYIYLYKKTAAEIYNRVTLSSSTATGDGVEYGEAWMDFEIQKVSYSANGALEKYEILGLIPSNRYAVAKVYNSLTSDDIKTILKVSFEYLIAVDPDDPTKRITTINQLKSIKVLDTYNAFQLMRISLSDVWNQMHYAAFNLDTQVDHIQKVELQYSSQNYICDTTINDTIADAKEDRFTFGFNKKKCKSVNYVSEKISNKVTVKPEEKKVVTDGFGWARRRYTWNTLGATSDVDDKLLSSEIKNRYKWLVNFANNDIYAPRRYHGLTAYYDLTDPQRASVEVTGLNFLQFWYVSEGETRTAIAVDRYTDSAGNIPAVEGDNFAFFEEFIAKIGYFFNQFGPFMLLAIGGVAGLFVLSILASSLRWIRGRR